MAMEAEAQLRGAGLRVTRPRLAVHAALAARPHASAATLLERARRDHPALSSQAVYGILDDLVAAGLVRRFAPPAGAARYELRRGDNHHHVTCVECGRIDDVPCVTGAAPCLDATGVDGYELLAAEVTFLGRCPACRGSGPVQLAETAEPIEAIRPASPLQRPSSIQHP